MTLAHLKLLSLPFAIGALRVSAAMASPQWNP
jgi:hypothetical protein